MVEIIDRRIMEYIVVNDDDMLNEMKGKVKSRYIPYSCNVTRTTTLFYTSYPKSKQKI